MSRHFQGQVQLLSTLDELGKPALTVLCRDSSTFLLLLLQFEPRNVPVGMPMMRLPDRPSKYSARRANSSLPTDPSPRALWRSIIGTKQNNFHARTSPTTSPTCFARPPSRRATGPTLSQPSPHESRARLPHGDSAQHACCQVDIIHLCPSG